MLSFGQNMPKFGVLRSTVWCLRTKVVKMLGFWLKFAQIWCYKVKISVFKGSKIVQMLGFGKNLVFNSQNFGFKGPKCWILAQICQHLVF